MKNALIRLARILVAQAISWAVLEWGGISVPIIGITVGAVINSIAKYLRDKFPAIGNWLPV